MINGFQKEFICGRKFQDVADFVRDTDKEMNYSKLKNKSIIWCKVNFASELFLSVKNSSNAYVLITHNGDWPISKEFFESKPPCIKRWFAQNVDFVHKDLIPLPIGMENDCGPSKGPNTDHKLMIKYLPPNYSVKKSMDKIYCNFMMHHWEPRKAMLATLIKKDLAFMDKRCDYNTFCSNMAKYQFIASPRGNGIDTHRTWEALYLGLIPIVEKHFMYDSYPELPIVQIGSWEEVDRQWMKDKYEWFLKTKFSYDKLKISYWFEKILKERSSL